jgi:acetyl-CoA carboxylase biotin carboxyl carrier protein
MDLQYLSKLMKLFDGSSAVELEIEEDGTKLRLSKAQEVPVAAQHPMMPMYMPQYAPPPSAYMAHQTSLAPQNNAVPPSAPTTASAQDVPKPAVPAIKEDKLHQVLSPIVGTFYRAPAPDVEPFTQVGNRVTTGQALCIIEAMKLMNEIESDVSGVIVKILVENGQPVEYNQPLFVIQID